MKDDPIQMIIDQRSRRRAPAVLNLRGVLEYRYESDTRATQCCRHLVEIGEWSD